MRQTYKNLAHSVTIVCCSIVLMLQSGCLISHSNHTVLRQDEALRPITFGSEEARNIFESCVGAECKDEGRKSSGSFAIPFLVGLERSRTVSKTAIRNDVAARLDVNGDSHISDYEAALPKKR